MIILIKNGNDWVEGQPVIGEPAKFIYPNGAEIIVSAYAEPGSGE